MRVSPAFWARHRIPGTSYLYYAFILFALSAIFRTIFRSRRRWTSHFDLMGHSGLPIIISLERGTNKLLVSTEERERERVRVCLWARRGVLCVCSALVDGCLHRCLSCQYCWYRNIVFRQPITYKFFSQKRDRTRTQGGAICMEHALGCPNFALVGRST